MHCWPSNSPSGNPPHATHLRSAHLMFPLDFVVVRFHGPQLWRRLASTLRRRAPSWLASRESREDGDGARWRCAVAGRGAEENCRLHCTSPRWSSQFRPEFHYGARFAQMDAWIWADVAREWRIASREWRVARRSSVPDQDQDRDQSRSSLQGSRVSKVLRILPNFVNFGPKQLGIQLG